MTVEERARECATEMKAGDIWSRAIEAIEKHLREQIEACAKIGDQIAVFLKENKLSSFGDVEYVALRIRALAKPTEERKEIER